MELVDTPDLGSGAERCGGSSPPSRTKYQRLNPENRAYNCVQNKEEIEDFTWRVYGCEELVGIIGDDLTEMQVGLPGTIQREQA